MTIISTTKFLEFKSTPSPSGKDWYYVRRTNDTSKHDSAVVITTVVKYNNEYSFLLFKTRRPPVYAENKAIYCLESPAGLIGDNDYNEEAIACAKKELLEETGLIATRIYEELLNCCTSAGLSSETLSYVTAIVDNYELHQEPVSDGGIIIERFFVPVKKIKDYLDNLNKKEVSVAAATICGIYYALERLKTI